METLFTSLVCQCFQLSWIILETPDFGPYLPVSRLESGISRIITKVAISCRIDFPTIKIFFKYFVLFELLLTWNISLKILVCPPNLKNNVAKYELFMRYIRQSESTSIFGTNDVIICCAIWHHLSFLPYQFWIFDDVGGWQPWKVPTEVPL